MLYIPDKLQKDLKKLPGGLIAHCERASEVCRELAGRFGYNPEKAKATALMHDIARDMDDQDILIRAAFYGLQPLPVEEDLPILLHGPVGAAMLRQEYGVADDEILSAVACHTTGKRGMALLDRILFLGDKLDPEKVSSRPELREVEALAGRDLDGAILRFFDLQLTHLILRGQPIHPAMVDARNELLVP